MIPLYGFLEGDTIGLLILADEEDTLASLSDKLQSAASVRVAHRPNVVVEVRGQPMDPALTVKAAQLGALDRFDVREGS
jgi:hypothetical protein